MRWQNEAHCSIIKFLQSIDLR